MNASMVEEAGPSRCSSGPRHMTQLVWKPWKHCFAPCTVTGRAPGWPLQLLIWMDAHAPLELRPKLFLGKCIRSTVLFSLPPVVTWISAAGGCHWPAWDKSSIARGGLSLPKKCSNRRATSNPSAMVWTHVNFTDFFAPVAKMPWVRDVKAWTAASASALLAAVQKGAGTQSRVPWDNGGPTGRVGTSLVFESRPIMTRRSILLVSVFNFLVGGWEIFRLGGIVEESGRDSSASSRPECPVFSSSAQSIAHRGMGASNSSLISLAHLSAQWTGEAIGSGYESSWLETTSVSTWVEVMLPESSRRWEEAPAQLLVHGSPGIVSSSESIAVASARSIHCSNAACTLVEADIAHLATWLSRGFMFRARLSRRALEEKDIQHTRPLSLTHALFRPSTKKKAANEWQTGLYLLHTLSRLRTAELSPPRFVSCHHHGLFLGEKQTFN